jgi:sigma-B regulation protein RsbU (phosphoserine phosphatase)
MTTGAPADPAAEIARLEGELEQMTTELIEIQDQHLAVLDLARATRRRVGLDEVLADLIREVSRLAGTEMAFAVLPDTRGGDELVCYPPATADLTALLEEVHTWSTTTGQPLIANSNADLPNGITPRASVRNLVFAPIVIDGQAYAVLGVMNRQHGGFSAGTVKLLEALAEYAGGVIEHALILDQLLERERLHRERELAATMQARLMRIAPPEVAGLDIVGRYRPATEVGGDFYDVRLRRDGRLSFAVADVSGKGLPATFLMGMARTVFRASGLLLRDIAGVVAQANFHLYEDLTNVDSFVTAFAGHYTPSTRRIRYANAGHSPVIYRPHDAPARFLTATGLPLGILPESSYTAAELWLDSGDLLVVGTDGFSEASTADNELFGYPRLLEAVDELATASARVIVDSLFDAVSEFSRGRPQDDDQTLLVLRGVSLELEVGA